MQLDLAILSDSYSIVGIKECNFSDQKNEVFRYSDTGGIFGDKKDFRLNDSDFYSQSNPIVVTSGLGDTKSQALCKVTFLDGNVIFTCDAVSEFLTALSNLYPSEKHPLVYFPAVLKPAEASRFAEAFDPENNSRIQKMWESESAAIVNADLTDNFALPIAMSRIGDRIRLSTLYLESSELPVSALSIQVVGNKITCTKKLLLGGIQVSGFTISFPDSRLAASYVLRLGLSLASEQPESSSTILATDKLQESLTSQVKVRGVITGKEVNPFECDADLTTTGLTLRPSDKAAPEVHFNFASPNVAIDGTSDAFLITDNGTALHISATSESFHNAIQNNHALRSAAHRSANVGPFVATSLAGDPVRIEVESDRLTLIQGDSVEALPIAPSEPPILDWTDTTPVLKMGSLAVSAQLPMLEGISASALAFAVIPQVRADFHGCISSLIGLEGKYFSYTALGRLAECHLSISSAAATQPFGSMASMSSEYERNIFLAFVVQNAAQLARDFETTVNYLPAFAIARDVDFLTHIGAADALCARTVEQAYQRALGTISTLVSHLYRLDGYISRLTSMRKALAQEDGWGKFLPLGVSAAASLVNPFALVGVAQQGVSLLTRNDSRATMEQDVFADAFDSSSKEWDYVVHSILPSVTYRLCQEIYPIRLSTSAILIGIYDKADPATRERIEMLVAQRLARLTTFLDFPSGLDQGRTRGQVTDFLFQLQKQAEAYSLRHF